MSPMCVDVDVHSAEGMGQTFKVGLGLLMSIFTHDYSMTS